MVRTHHGAMAAAAGVILVPGVPLPVLAGTQVLNAVPLLAVLPVVVRLGRDPACWGSTDCAGPGPSRASSRSGASPRPAYCSP